jgi:two-component system sensor histidine kinase HydH
VSAIEVIFLTSSAFSLATGFSVVALNPRRTANVVFAIVTVLSALWLLCVFMAMREGSTAVSNEYGALLFWLRMTNIVAAFLPWSFFLTKEALLADTPFLTIIQRSWLWLSAACILAAVAASESFIPSDSTPEVRKYGIGYALYSIAMTILCCLILIQAFGQMQKCSGIRQLETRLFLINSCFCTLAILAANSLGSRLEMPSIRCTGAFVVSAYNALTIWSVFQYRIFDARQILTTLGHRVSTLGILAISLLGLYRFTNRSINETGALLLSTILAGAVSAIWHVKSRTWLRLDASQMMAGPRAGIVEYARKESDAGKLITWFEAFLREWCQTELVIFSTAEHKSTILQILQTSDLEGMPSILRQTGFITPEILGRRRLDHKALHYQAFLTSHKLGALLIAPKGSHSPSCVIALGHKNSLRPYTYPDLKILSELTELMDNILAHSRAASRAAQIDKMESAAMMSRGLAHDLNNLATPVSTFLLHMEGRVGPGTVEAEVLADAKHSVRVMQDYIRESLFFARRLVPNFESLSIRELFTSTIKVTQSRAQFRDVNVMAPGEPDVRLCGDRVLLLRLMQNLALNAIDATPAGGSVTLSAASDGNDRVVLAIADQGRGIPAEIRDRIFEPYFTTKDTGHEIRGMGLGLAICLKISDLHGGVLHTSNAPSGGAIFTVALPVNPKGTTHSADPDHHNPAADPVPLDMHIIQKQVETKDVAPRPQSNGSFHSRC